MRREILSVSPLAARQFVLRAQGLDTPFASIAVALDHLGYVQIDPLNICGRMHDLILRNRVTGYREGDLSRFLHPETGTGPSGQPSSPRLAFEHHHPSTHILVAFPLDAWPHLLGAMRDRAHSRSGWSGSLTPTERRLAPELIAAIGARGPLGSEDFADSRPARRIVWGKSTLVKSTLQKLFFHGELLIGDRQNNRRRYDLPARVLPPEILALPAAPARETKRWIALLKLRQRRLATLTRDELRCVEDAVQPVTIEGCPPAFCLVDDAPLLAAGGDETNHAAPPVRFLAPLDPVIYDRRLTSALWQFDYTWEAYTPAAKRQRGHYALPVLAGTELVGHVEPKADRARGKLVIVSRAVRRGVTTQAALNDLATWLGLRR